MIYIGLLATIISAVVFGISSLYMLFAASSFGGKNSTGENVVGVLFGVISVTLFYLFFQHFHINIS